MLDSPNRFSEKTLVLEGRNFSLKILRFSNGCFVSVSEAGDRLGSMVASMASGPVPLTTTVIPSKSGSLFMRLVAERISSRMRGIALISSDVQGELGDETAKSLMGEIMDMMCDE